MSRKSNQPVKNAKGSVWKALKKALTNGATKAPEGTVLVSKTTKKKGLGN